MKDSIERPNYFEGQILGAEDLSAGLDYNRFALARHARYAHTPGIAAGLKLQAGQPKKTVRGTAYVEVTVTPGVAIDGSGREIVIPSPHRLDEDLIAGVAVGDTDEYDDKKGPCYPVFLIGLDEAAPGGARGAGTEAPRVSERAEIRLGRPGDEVDLDSRAPPEDVTSGPEGGVAWRLLLGFVRITSMQAKSEPRALFAEVQARSPDTGVGPRYIGVMADEVAAQSGRLELRSRPRTQVGKPVLMLDDAVAGGELIFGLQDGQGGVNKLLTVNAKGDLVAAGKLAGLSASVFIDSGIVADGMVLPLPTGMTQEQVSSGKLELQIYLTPRAPGKIPPFQVAGADKRVWGVFPLECFADEDRRVTCVFRWFLLDATPGATAPPRSIYDYPGACDYVVLALVPSGKEAGQ
jgi:hypothetical protein